MARKHGFGATQKAHTDRMNARRNLVENSLALARAADVVGDCHNALRSATEAEHYMGMVEAEAYSRRNNEMPAWVGELANKVANLWGTIARKCVR